MKPNELLDKMIGDWQLTGWMGEVELHQRVTARWTLSGTFVEMELVSEVPADNPTHDYSAVYYFGYNVEASVYVMYLLDSTEVPLDFVVGLAKREANRLPFLFEYQDVDFLNIFEWLPAEDSWTSRQIILDGDEEKQFATKTLRRID